MKRAHSSEAINQADDSENSPALSVASSSQEAPITFAVPAAQPAAIAAKSEAVGDDNRSPEKRPKSSGISELEIEKTIKDAKFRSFAKLMRQSLVDIRILPGQEPCYVPIPDDCPEVLRRALESLNFKQLYSHQLECRNRVREGRNVIITTPTSSGKSLSFNFAIVEQLLLNPGATALYLFPLNALAKDQTKKLQDLNAQLGSHQMRICTTMGATSDSGKLKNELELNSGNRIVITNPDFLHWQIYRGGHHYSKNWSYRQYIRQLRYVVLDEAHTYKGVMGAHVGCLIRRLRAHIQECGGDAEQLRFILASATVANGIEMAKNLISCDDVVSVTSSGAPLSQKTMITLQPCDDPSKKTAEIIKYWIELRLKGIVFCDAVSSTTSLLSYMKQSKDYSACVKRCRAYYSAKNDNDKADILKTLQDPKSMVSVIISTSALEAGVDITELDAVLLHSFPGSRMSFFQRIGRAGRAREGLAIFLPRKTYPMDNYYAAHPHQLVNKTVESVTFNKDYPAICKGHLMCSAAEQSLFADEELLKLLWGPKALEYIDQMLEAGELVVSGSGSKFVRSNAGDLPHFNVNIRGAGGRNTSISCQIRDRDGKLREWGESSASIEQAFWRLFPGARIDEQDSKSGKLTKYLVERLDLKEKKAYLTENVNISYSVLRTPLVAANIRLDVEWGRKCFALDGYPTAQIQIAYGYGAVKSELLGYSEYDKKKTVISAVAGSAGEEILYPQPFSYEHKAPVLRIAFTPAALKLLESRIPPGMSFNNATCLEVMMHTIQHQLLNAVPMLLLSQEEIVESRPKVSHGEAILADSYDGGTGVCEAIFENFEQFWQKASEMSRSCTECGGKKGCPICLYHKRCCTMNRNVHPQMGCAHIKITPAEPIPLETLSNPVKKGDPVKDRPRSQGLAIDETAVAIAVESNPAANEESESSESEGKQEQQPEREAKELPPQAANAIPTPPARRAIDLTTVTEFSMSGSAADEGDISSCVSEDNDQVEIVSPTFPGPSATPPAAITNAGAVTAARNRSSQSASSPGSAEKKAPSVIDLTGDAD